MPAPFFVKDSHGGILERSIKAKVESQFSPSASQASLQTSTVQARNRTMGAEMTLIKKKDVDNYFAAKRRRQRLLISPASKSRAAGFSDVANPRTKAGAVSPIEVHGSKAPVVKSPMPAVTIGWNSRSASVPDVKVSARR
jgi:hypothetical protein